MMMNNILWAMFGNEHLVQSSSSCIVNINPILTIDNFITALSRLFKEMTSNSRTSGSVNPSSFRSTFIQYESKFRGYE